MHYSLQQKLYTIKCILNNVNTRDSPDCHKAIPFDPSPSYILAVLAFLGCINCIDCIGCICYIDCIGCVSEMMDHISVLNQNKQANVL